MKIESFINRNVIKVSLIMSVFVFALFMAKSAHASAVVCFETQPGATQLNQIWGYKSTNGSCAVPGDAQYKDTTQSANKITITVLNTASSGGETLTCTPTTPTIPTPISQYFTVTTSSSCSNIAPQASITYSVTPYTIFTNTSQNSGVVTFAAQSNLPTGTTGTAYASSDTITFYYQATSTAIYGACTLSVSTIYDGTPSQAIPNTYSYTLTSNNTDFDTNGVSQNLTGAINSKQYSTYYNSSNWNISGITAPSGFTFTGLDPATPSSQTCPSSGGNISYTLHFNGTPQPPTNVIADNTVACETIVLTWYTAQNDNYYNIARDSQGNIITTITPSPLPAVGTAETYTDDISTGVHTYYIQGGNSSGTSTWVSTGNIVPVPCVVNFTNSDKVLTKVNGAAYRYAASKCIGSSTGNVQTLKTGDTVTFRLNLCNDGNIPATSVVVTDTIDSTHVSNPIAGSIVYTDSSGHSSNLTLGASGTPGVTQSGNILTFTLPNIAPAAHPYIIFNATLLAPTGANTQLINRFTNTGTIKCAQPACPVNIALTDGYIVYYNGSVPAQQEINP